MSITQATNRVQQPALAIPRHADPRVAFFDRLAPDWDQTGPDPTVTLRRLETMRADLGLQPGQSLLEIGCGTGQVTGWLRDAVRPGRVLSVDFSPVMLEQARRRLPEAEFRLLDVCAAPHRTGPVDCTATARRDAAPYRTGQVHEEPRGDCRFDVIWCFHVFPHLRDQAAALRRMASWLVPGGQLVVLHLSGSAALNAFHHQAGGAVAHDRLPSLPEFEPLLEVAGFDRVFGEDCDDRFLLRALLRRIRVHP